MANRTQHSRSTKNFHHPFKPYDIQQDFMEALYDCIEQGQVGIFESPTGTGKSLSLICGSITWLREHKRRTFDEAVANIEIGNEEPEWMLEHAKEARSREIRQMRADLEKRLALVREREKRLKKRLADGEPPQKRRKEAHESADAIAEDEQFVLDDYESDQENENLAQGEYSTGTTKLLEKLGMLTSHSRDGDNVVDIDEPKIYFCSRTHSQLSQFVGELRRVQMPPGLPPEDEGETEIMEELKHLTLGSRKNLCINSRVSKLPTQTAINERCVELQQSKVSAVQKCPFIPSKESEDLVLDFQDNALASIQDIEDLANLGRKLHVCPYYATRPAIGPAEIVTLPYPLLLQKSAREALGISLKGHVVIIDEAHNLLNAVEGIYSAEISTAQLKRVKDALIQYLQKFRNRLKGSNRTYVTQLVRVLDSLIQHGSDFEGKLGGKTSSGALLAGKGVDQINLSKLVRYITESKLARKVESYTLHVQNLEAASRPHTKGVEKDTNPDVPTLMHVQNFLSVLMNPSKEGQFLWSREDGQVIIRYLLLDPSEHFREIVEEARAVVLAGGTMSPIEDYKQQLFPYLPSIKTFSCGHLIPSRSLLVRAVTSDVHGRIDFSFKARNQATSRRLGEALEKLMPEISGGIVVFMPSYGYLESVVQVWRERLILTRLEAAQPVFSDSRTVAAEETFRTYADAVRSHKRALLLSVVGGKLSEGINFSDDLGRCVIVVGLPYPNLHTPAWQAKMQYLEERAASRGEATGVASREHADNVCMRSVNQAIGRAIRHKDDWASILLFDARYADARIRAKLPGWINAGQTDGESGLLDDVVKDISVFFKGKIR